MPIVAGAEPFHHDGGLTGVLLCHGLTGSPASTRPWAEVLSAAGLTVDVPRLPGHGTIWQELNTTRWPDWFSAVERALHRVMPSFPALSDRRHRRRPARRSLELVRRLAPATTDGG